MALTFDVVVSGKRGQVGSAVAELLGVVKDDFGAVVVFLDPAFDRDFAALQLADVADRVEISAKHDHRERAGVVVGAEIEKRDAIVALLNAHHGSLDAVCFADMLLGLGDGEAVLGFRMV